MYPAHIRGDGTIQTCQMHCVNVAELSKKCLKDIGLANSGYLAGLLHDCGKFTEEFSEYITKAARGEVVRKGSVIHSFAGENCLLQYYHNIGEQQKLTSEILAYSIGSHHGLFDCFNESSECGFTERYIKQHSYDLMAISNFHNACADKKQINDCFEESVKEIEQHIKSLKSLCETSGRKYTDLLFLISFLIRMLLSAVVDADRKDTACFMSNTAFPNLSDNACIWPECLKNITTYLDSLPNTTKIQKARRELSDICLEAARKPTGIYRLNLPTGAGKTLSALRFALDHALRHGKERIFYVSPLLSIIDQNADVIRRAIGNDKIILEHHSDVINESKDAQEQQWHDHLTETWDSPIIITTLVQFLNTLFSGKMSSVRRFHSLKNSIIIIDEIQTVPSKMLTLFNLALDYLSGMCNTTFILCSATHPELGCTPHPIITEELVTKKQLKNYENVFERNILIDKGGCKFDEIKQYILEMLTIHHNVLVVCNKKSQSAKLFHMMKDENIKCFHLSAGMCTAHRKKTLNEIKQHLQSQEKCVCISTQVIEAGVDISFEAVIRLSAGLDNIVQSAGRCNRNGESKSLSPVWIVKCEDENLSKLKEISDAKSSSEALFDAYARDPKSFSDNLSSDKSVSFYYQKLFGAKPQGYFDFTVPGNSIYSLLSDNEKWRDPEINEYFINQAFKSAGELFEVFDSGQKSLIVPWGDGKQIISQLSITKNNIKELTKSAKPYTISVYEYQFQKLEGIGAITLFADGAIAALSDGYYDENTGIKEVNDECSIQIW